MGNKTKNFVKGMGSVLEVAPPPKESSLFEEYSQRSDVDLLQEDWGKVGNDILAACFLSFQETHRLQQESYAELLLKLRNWYVHFGYGDKSGKASSSICRERQPTLFPDLDDE